MIAPVSQSCPTCGAVFMGSDAIGDSCPSCTGLSGRFPTKKMHPWDSKYFSIPRKTRLNDNECYRLHVFANEALGEIKRLEAKVAEADAILNTPRVVDFLEGVRLEAAHQRQRWGTAHDRWKSAENWFWLVGYLAGKALRACIDGDNFKAKHHTISAAAALMNWHETIGDPDHPFGLGADEDLKAKDR